MQRLNVAYEAKRVVLHCLGDMHLGCKQSEYGKFHSAVSKCVRDKKGLFLGMGDYCDTIEPVDPRYDPEMKQWTIEEQYDFLKDEFRRVQNKTLGVLLGNHGGSTFKKRDMNYIRMICKDLQINYLGYEAAINLTLEWKDIKHTFKLLAHHGYGGGEWMGAKINRAQRIPAKFLNCDIVLSGHTHMLSDIIVTLVDPFASHYSQKYIWFGWTGSFYRTYKEGVEGYAEQRQYFPLPVGYLKVKLDVNGNIQTEKVLM